jgi:hypothetical protein
MKRRTQFKVLDATDELIKPSRLTKMPNEKDPRARQVQ